MSFWSFITEIISIVKIPQSKLCKKGVFILNKESFEEDFILKYESIKNIKVEPESFQFDYLDNPEGGIKAIKVKMISDNVEYQATNILNVAE